MKILVKYPTRSRGKQFLELMAQMLATVSDRSSVHFLVSYDLDDTTMDERVVEAVKSMCGKSLTIVGGSSQNKIHACNRDLADYTGKWDAVLLLSDDMIPQFEGWDKVVIESMQAHFPDTDGCLWFNDGHQDRICTLSIIGRKYYDRFGYMYHPSYVSLWCDNEFTEVAQALGKIKYSPLVLFKHHHPMWMGQREKMDALYKKNEGFYHVDKRNYEQRKRHAFAA